MTDRSNVFEQRRAALIDRIVALARDDVRVAALWLQGSLADGTADALSDVDAYLCIRDQAFDEVYGERLEVVRRIGRPLAYSDERGLGAITCVVAGPVKLDLFFEPVSTAATRQRSAVRMLVDKDGIGPALQTGWSPAIADAARRVETVLRGTFQGAMWPVRVLMRGQLATFAMMELELINDMLVTMMAARVDARLLFKNRFTVSRLLPPEQQAVLHALTLEVVEAVAARDPAAMRRAHLRITERLLREGRAACAALDIEFPIDDPGVEAIREFYEREWPVALPSSGGEG